MNFSGRTVIVTGGTGALGRVLVRRFAESGANVAVPSQSIRSGEMPANTVILRADLRDEEAVEKFANDVHERFGSIDVLVNAAGGYAGGKKTEDLSAGEVMDMFLLNTVSAFNMCRRVIPFMKRKGYGRIVNLAAMTALHPQGGAGPYAMSKRAVITLTETIAAENKRSGITANAVAPSIIDTEANRMSMPDADFRKWVTPDQVADVVLFLASESGSAVSGSVVVLP